MSTDNARIEGEPVIEVDLGGNGGSVAFHTLEEVKRWIDRELVAWDRHELREMRSPAIGYILQRQLQLPHVIRESLEKIKEMQGDEQHTALKSIKNQFEQYADYRSLYSASQVGDEILMMIQNKQLFLAIGALASNLGIPASDLVRGWHSKEGELGVVLSGYALCHTSNMVRRSDLAEHRRRMEIQLNHLDNIRRQAANDQDQLKTRVTNTIEESTQALKREQAGWATFSDTTQNDWKTIRDTFESQLRLESPVKYWRKRADDTSKIAKRSLIAFVATALAIIGSLVVFGPELLERVSAIKNAGPFTTLAFVSIPALTALWVLKHAARLFVTNSERSADARLRETMTTTFLALTKEGAAEIDRDERLLILEALFRPPAPAPSDDGHWAGLSALLSRRNS